MRKTRGRGFALPRAMRWECHCLNLLYHILRVERNDGRLLDVVAACVRHCHRPVTRIGIWNQTGTTLHVHVHVQSAATEHTVTSLHGHICSESADKPQATYEVAHTCPDSLHHMTAKGTHDEFYVRYYVGHRGDYGHEFTEFELSPSGRLRYANNSGYKHETSIRKEVFVSPAVVKETRRIILESGIIKLNDSKWNEPDDGRQELEITIGNEHITFTCAEIGSLADIQKSLDPEGLKTFYHITQDLKSLFLTLIDLHFKKKPFG